MNTPDTTIEGNDLVADTITAAFEGHGNYDTLAELLVDLEPVLAAIRRHAAAEALKEQARAIGKTADFFRQQARAVEGKSMTSADIYRAMADQCNNDSNRLAKAARDTIAEGWEHVCAAYTWATRSDPGYGCDTPVESEGDYCDRHEPADDDRDAD